MNDVQKSEQEGQQTLVDNPFGQRDVAEHSATGHAVATREASEVQSAMVIAKRFPRDPIEAMDKILTACTRQSLAAQATYQYARGGTDISGPSIRLAEEMQRNWGNMVSGVMEIARYNGVSECLAYSWDLENNVRDERRFTVRHWRDTRKGGYPITDERDIYELIANQGSRRKRACILALIPGDVTEAAVHQCDVTLRNKVAVTPERIKEMLARFAEYGITQAHIEARIQRRIESITPALMVQLGKIHNSLRDGMSNPADWFEVGQEDGERPSSKDKLDALASNGNDEPTKAAEPEPQRKAAPEPERQEQPKQAADGDDDLGGLFGADT